MWQIMESLFDQVQTLQQNQAIHFSSVHDRLDAVELELPLIQEQSALRIRDIEVRMTGEVQDAVEEATSGLQNAFMGKLGSLTELIENQQRELAQIRESRQLTETRLSHAVRDIERLCGELTPHRDNERFHSQPESPGYVYPPQVGEHPRKVAFEFSRGPGNSLVAEPNLKRSLAYSENGIPDARLSRQGQPTSARSAFHRQEAAKPDGERVLRSKPAESSVPGFDDWKLQFMLDPESSETTLPPAQEAKDKIPRCPKCLSERIRPATHTRLDLVFRLIGLTPHRCRACTHRFYKYGPPVSPAVHPDETHAPASMGAVNASKAEGQREEVRTPHVR